MDNSRVDPHAMIEHRDDHETTTTTRPSSQGMVKMLSPTHWRKSGARPQDCPQLLAGCKTTPIWEFRKIGGTLLWGSYNKDPTIQGTIVGSPIFGNPHMLSPSTVKFRTTAKMLCVHKLPLQGTALTNSHYPCC